MSSRPDCNFCSTTVAMGTCDCGRNLFGPLTSKEKIEQEDYFRRMNKTRQERRYHARSLKRL